MSEHALVPATPTGSDHPASGPDHNLSADAPRAPNFEQRCVDAVNALTKDALDQQSLATLADVLAWALARVIAGCDTVVTAGDVMRRLGGYVCDLHERQQALEESRQARKEGLPLH